MTCRPRYTRAAMRRLTALLSTAAYDRLVAGLCATTRPLAMLKAGRATSNDRSESEPAHERTWRQEAGMGMVTECQQADRHRR